MATSSFFALASRRDVFNVSKIPARQSVLQFFLLPAGSWLIDRRTGLHTPTFHCTLWQSAWILALFNFSLLLWLVFTCIQQHTKRQSLSLQLIEGQLGQWRHWAKQRPAKKKSVSPSSRYCLFHMHGLHTRSIFVLETLLVWCVLAVNSTWEQPLVAETNCSHVFFIADRKATARTTNSLSHVASRQKPISFVSFYYVWNCLLTHANVINFNAIRQSYQMYQEHAWW